MSMPQQSPTNLTSLGIRLDGEDRVAITGTDSVTVIYTLSAHALSTGPTGALLLDMDGTSLRSEHFWVGMLEEAVRFAAGPNVTLDDSDKAMVQGATTREHLAFLIQKLRLDITLHDMIKAYDAVVESAFYHHDVSGLAQDILLQPGFGELRAAAVAAGLPFLLVTNGNFRKADVETRIIAHHLGLDEVESVSDGVWCAPRQEGWLKSFGASTGKPHPWPYLEAATKGAGIDPKDLGSVIAVDDSAAGVCSIRLAGLKSVGLAGGNIKATGADIFCDEFVESLHDICDLLQTDD